MPSSKTGLTVSDEKKYVGILFFLFAFQIMSWVPRFPEIKANLALSNGEFGTYLSLGSVGAVIAMLSSGHFVHKLGAKKVLIISTLGMCLSIGAIVHLQSAPIFIIVNMINGASISAFNIALNAQAFHAQDRAGELILSRQHGYWTMGAVATAIFSGFMVEFVGIAIHIDSLSAIIFLTILVILNKLEPELIKPSVDDDSDFGFKDLFTSFRIDYFGFSCIDLRNHGRILYRRLVNHLCKRDYWCSWLTSNNSLHPYLHRNDCRPIGTTPNYALCFTRKSD
jgi:MFS family permease